MTIIRDPEIIPANTDDTVEAVMGQIVTDLGASLGVLLSDLGLRTGIWRAMVGAGPLSIAEIAARAGVHAALVGEWARAQAAAGHLSYEADEDRFTLPAAALLQAWGGAITACTEMLQRPSAPT